MMMRIFVLVIERRPIATSVFQSFYSDNSTFFFGTLKSNFRETIERSLF